MGARNRRLLLAGSVLLSLPALRAQNTPTFAYTGDDALLSAANVHRVNFGGFANSVLLEDQKLLFPFLPSLVYETGYLLWPSNRHANVSLNVAPEVFVTVFFMGRITGTAEVVLFNEASTRHERGVGLRIGAGYSALGSSFDFAETTPVLRAGFLIGNIRATYMHSVGRNAIIDHQLGVAIKFDW